MSRQRPGVENVGDLDPILFNDFRTGANLTLGVMAAPITAPRGPENRLRLLLASPTARMGRAMELVDEIPRGWGYDCTGHWHRPLAEVVPIREAIEPAEEDPLAPASGAMRGSIVLGHILVANWSGRGSVVDETRLR